MSKLPVAQSHSPNYVSAILDEIALEGLDGITPIDLWLRLSDRPNFPIQPADEDCKNVLWNVVKRLTNVTFYELPEARKPLILFDRYENVDPYLGMVMEPEILPDNIYPHAKVDDFAAGIMGSCSTYNTRIDVTSQVRKMTYEECFNKWGHKLVVVANQAARNRALRNPDVNPNLELTVMQYCVLERIGRSRYHGEVTQGKISLQLMGEDAKTLFYHRKVLQKQRLITKQMFHQKLGAQNCSGLLLHLPRFFVERKPKALVLTEQIITFLKTQRNVTCEYDKIRSELNLGNSLKKIMKTFNFQKFVRSDVVPYRSIYPDAKESEWKCKGSSKEKVARVLQLIDPKMDIKDIWAKYDDIYEDDDDERTGYLDEGSRLLDRTMFSQAFNVVDSAGPDGLSQIQMGLKLGVTKLQSRAICRKLIKTKATSIFMSDVGRQRVSRYVSKRYDNKSKLGQQFTKEKARMRELVGAQVLDKQVTDVDNVFMELGEVGIGHTPVTNADDSKVTDFMGEKSGVVEEHEDSEQMEWSSDLTALNIKNEETVPVLKTKSTKRKKRCSLEKNKTKSAVEKEEKKDSKLSSVTSEEETSIIEDSLSITPTKKRKKSSTIKEDNLIKSVGKTKNIIEEDMHQIKEDMQVIEMEVVEPKIQKSSKTMNSGLVEEALSVQDSPNVTSRLLKRANMIIEAVQEHKVIFDLCKLQKMISEYETKKGFDGRMDKKSLQRILFKLEMDGHVKNLTIKLKGYGKERILAFVCHPSVTNGHSVIRSAIEQAKMKFVILNRETIKKNRKNPKISRDITSDLFDEGKSEKVPSNLKYNSRIGKSYGFCPKFLRMQVLHKVMFYLTYGYEGNTNLDQEEALNEIKKLYNVTEEVQSEMSQVYVASIDWKMFMPPLPKHSGYASGWCLMSDLLLRLPLSIFLQLVNVMYEVPELDEYLNHPIRKHLLVKNLPLFIRKALTVGRKYIFTIHELITRLCYMGLAQVGPLSLKEKDQVFIYINKNAQLSDTSSSPCGYHKVSQDIDYPIHKYKFETSANVEHFWYDCWNFCMHTLLGGRLCISGKEVVLETLANKPCMIEAIEPRTIDEVVARDVSYVPGDGLGAAGLDSAMFAHLKRNWYWTNQESSNSSNPSSALTSLHTAEKKDIEKKTARKVEFVRVKPQTSSAVPKKHRRMREKKIETKEKTSTKPKRSKLSKEVTVRLLKPPRKISVRKPYYDQVDREALLKMNKLRVDWSPVEDNLLLLCKVASVILCANAKTNFHNFVVVREVLHSAIPESRNKTSRACQRRTNYVMKNPQTQRSVNLCVEEIKQDANIMERFGNFLQILNKNESGEKLTTLEKEEKWNEEFKNLIELLQTRFNKIHNQTFTSMSESFIIPDTVEEFLENYRVIRIKKSGKFTKTFHEVKSVVDIYYGVINAIIHSSLNTSADKTSWAYQLFNIYQHYPDKLLRAVMSKTRADQMISLRKSGLRSHLRSGNYLPLSASPYQLSISYLNLMTTRYQFELYNDCIETYNQLKDRWNDEEQEHEVVAFNGGSTALLVEFMTNELLNFSLEIPDQVIILDPTVAEKDETYARIVKRYQDILASYKDQELTSTVLFDDNYKPTVRSSLKRNADDDSLELLPTSQQNVVAKAATRIALYLTREDCDSSIEQKELQHAHDFFVVNSSKVFCSLVPKEKPLPKDSNELPSSLIPLAHSVIWKTLEEIERNSKFTDRGILNPELYEALSKAQIAVEFADNIIEFVKRKKEVGVTVAEIREKYGVTKEISELLSVLVEKEVLLRCGITTTHYVHHAFTRPWLVRSYHITRREREAMIKPHALILEINKEDNPSKSSEMNKTVSNKEGKAEEVSKLGTHVAERSCKRSDSAKGIIKKSAAFDPKLKSNVNVCIRPWIRVDGTVNRRILDRTLSSVLGHIMLSPGCTLKHLQERFCPALQPHHTRELAEILQKLNCVQFKSIKVSHRISLFSKPTTVTKSKAFGLEDENHIILEPDPMAVTRLGSFIAESAYSKT